MKTPVRLSELYSSLRRSVKRCDRKFSCAERKAHISESRYGAPGDPAIRGAVAFLVDVNAPEKTVRVNITARESQIEAIDRLAREGGMTRSAYMVQSAIRVTESTGRKVAVRR